MRHSVITFVVGLAAAGCGSVDTSIPTSIGAKADKDQHQTQNAMITYKVNPGFFHVWEPSANALIDPQFEITKPELSSLRLHADSIQAYGKPFEWYGDCVLTVYDCGSACTPIWGPLPVQDDGLGRRRPTTIRVKYDDRVFSFEDLWIKYEATNTYTYFSGTVYELKQIDSARLLAYLPRTSLEDAASRDFEIDGCTFTLPSKIKPDSDDWSKTVVGVDVRCPKGLSPADEVVYLANGVEQPMKLPSGRTITIHYDLDVVDGDWTIEVLAY